MRSKEGILYCLENIQAWKNYNKCGRTIQKDYQIYKHLY